LQRRYFAFAAQVCLMAPLAIGGVRLLTAFGLLCGVGTFPHAFLRPRYLKKEKEPQEAQSAHDLCLLCFLRFLHSLRYLHTQLAASFKSPVPLYCPDCGYGQSGRVRVPCAPVPVICSGATPFSTHFSSVPMESNVLTPGPPPQWAMPGTMNSRIQLL